MHIIILLIIAILIFVALPGLFSVILASFLIVGVIYVIFAISSDRANLKRIKKEERLKADIRRMQRQRERESREQKMLQDQALKDARIRELAVNYCLNHDLELINLSGDIITIRDRVNRIYLTARIEPVNGELQFRELIIKESI